MDVMETSTHHSVFHVQCILDGDDELWNNWKNLGTAMLQHVMNPLSCKELVRMCCFTESVKEHWQVVVVVKLFDFNL